ncbi:MAG TPA: N-6 DNA methylase [Pyrinomonadaceae bacterium]|jgi:type I restriction enzyme M protein
MSQATETKASRKAQEKINEVLHDEYVVEAVKRGIIEIKDNKVTYSLHQKKSYQWSDPEEWVRCRTIAYLIIKKGYPANRIKTEVTVPRRTPNDWADIVVYLDDRCKEPFLVVENKPENTLKRDREQGIEQLFGNANSLRAPYGLYDDYSSSTFFDVANFPPTERRDNVRGQKDAVPEQYGDVPIYQFVAGTENDIKAVKPSTLESKIRRAHSIIWAGGKRDPLTAFDEWSKLLFAKVSDERSIPTGRPRDFQVGTKETTATVANRIHKRFSIACKDDTTIFPHGIRINLSDKKIFEIVKVLQDVSFVRTDVDSIGSAFENFFGSVFRGELGQYFTMRQLSRFTVAMLGITHEDHLIDPTAGSGGFLLEALLQVWHSIDASFEGQDVAEINRIKLDFALHRVYGIEIHEILARICKINLLLHHDGHTNIEGDRSCLDAVFARPRLNPPQEKFSKIVGNPPFGDEVQEGDDDHLGSNTLSSFEIAADRDKVPSEQVIIERCVDLLEEGGRLGLILPDGIFNNQGELSNCPRVRRFLVKNGVIESIVSLPDYAFRKSGAQNKTSILFFRKFRDSEKYRFDRVYASAIADGESEGEALVRALESVNYKVFLAEANHLGYTTTGAPSDKNDLYIGDTGGRLSKDQSGTILGEYHKFLENPDSYEGRLSPDCMAVSIVEMWNAHTSHRLDPKYFLFKREERTSIPTGWIRVKIGEAMRRRDNVVRPESEPDKRVKVMTISQTGDIRPREAGKGNNPPDWLGMYFEDSSSTWFAADSGDVVFSSIDLWKGCISVVPEDFDSALVTKEFPIYEITDERLDPNFLSCLLRSRYYQRAFRAITTGHSNRRRTQVADFEALEICFPPDKDTQRQLVKDVMAAKYGQREAQNTLREAMAAFSDLIDGRGDEELPEIEEGASPEE